MTITGGAEPFTPAGGRELIQRLRQAGHGAVAITSGLRDVRLVIGGGEVGLESAGAPLAGGEQDELIRAFLCALFWEDPLALFEADGSRREDAPAIRVRAAPGPALEQLEQGLTELEPLREKVPSLELLVVVSGEPPPADAEAPAAKLFRAAARDKAGAMLSAAAEGAGLDAIDAAWAAVDLLEARQGTVKRVSPTVAMRRLKRAESAVEDGLVPGLRHEYLARGYARAEPRRATTYVRQAGDAHRFAGRVEAAVACYRSALALQEDDLGAREGLVLALAAQGRTQEVKLERQELIDRYVAAGLPLRARGHLAALGELTLEQRTLLLDCLLAAGEHAQAAELAERMAPTLPAAELPLLAERFARSGATGAALDRAVRATGVARLRPARRVLVGLIPLALVALAALGLEGWARVQLRAAVQRAGPELAAGRFEAAKGELAELALIASQVAAHRWPLPTCLLDPPRYLAQLDDLAADQALLDAHRARLAWRQEDDTLAADARLQELAGMARTRPLRLLIEGERGELTAYRQRVADEVKQLQDLTIAGRHRDALAHARRLVDLYANARDLFAERTVAVRVSATPRAAVLLVDGKLLEPLRRDQGEWEVRVGLDARRVRLEVSYSGHVSQAREVGFQDLREPEVSFELVALHPDQSLAAAFPEPEAGSAAERVRFVEERRSVAHLRTNARGTLTLEEAATQARLRDALQLPPDARVTVVAVSEFARKRVLLRELNVYLEDKARRRATPFRIEAGRMERPFTDEPGTADAPGKALLHDLGQTERWPALVDAIREAVAQMHGELSR